MATPTPTLKNQKWEATYKRVHAYYEQHNHCRIGQKEDKYLANWLLDQRRNGQLDRLSLKQRELLDRIGFVWENNKEREERAWNEKFERLKAFQQMHGHCMVPGSDNDKELGLWVRRLRVKNKQGKLKEAHVDKLRSIGFVWEMQNHNPINKKKEAFEQQWLKMFDRLKAFQAEYGHCRVPYTYKQDSELHNWVKKQRLEYGRGELTDERRLLLETLEFTWKVEMADVNVQGNAKRWEIMYQGLVDFRKRHGHANVHIQQSKKLAEWSKNQRQQYVKGDLSDYRTQKLDALGFIWSKKPLDDTTATARGRRHKNQHDLDDNNNDNGNYCYGLQDFYQENPWEEEDEEEEDKSTASKKRKAEQRSNNVNDDDEDESEETATAKRPKLEENAVSIKEDPGPAAAAAVSIKAIKEDPFLEEEEKKEEAVSGVKEEDGENMDWRTATSVSPIKEDPEPHSQTQEEGFSDFRVGGARVKKEEEEDSQDDYSSSRMARDMRQALTAAIQKLGSSPNEAKAQACASKLKKSLRKKHKQRVANKKSFKKVWTRIRKDVGKEFQLELKSSSSKKEKNNNTKIEPATASLSSSKEKNTTKKKDKSKKKKDKIKKKKDKKNTTK